jgi:hypothetical protein
VNQWVGGFEDRGEGGGLDADNREMSVGGCAARAVQIDPPSGEARVARRFQRNERALGDVLVLQRLTAGDASGLLKSMEMADAACARSCPPQCCFASERSIARWVATAWCSCESAAMRGDRVRTHDGVRREARRPGDAETVMAGGSALTTRGILPQRRPCGRALSSLKKVGVPPEFAAGAFGSSA